ncbi:MAG: Crp/Fnr family transcriptional regulator [Beijerinckiaceae bacterium]|nr:Crp/Fnr family transcriptional regulator [Beijerinckiaceae bacterium]
MSELSEVVLFHGLDAAAITALEQAVVIRRYAAGKAIISTDEPSTDIFFVLSGRVQAKRFAPDGHEVVYLDIAEGSYFGEFAAIDGQLRSADVIAIGEARIARMRAEQFHEFILRYPRIGLNLSRELVRKLRDLSARVFEFTVYPVPIRIRKAILRLAEQARRPGSACTIKPAPTHYEIAALTATHREAVTRELAFLAAQGILRTGRQTIEILDLPRLRALADPDPG